MEYSLSNGTLTFSKPLRKCKDGVKILFYRDPEVEKECTSYPVATADIYKGMKEIYLPTDCIKLFEVIVKQPRFKFFPWFFYTFIRINPKK